MTPRERRLAILLGFLIVALVIGVGGYFGVYGPLAERYQAAERLQGEIDERTAKWEKYKAKDEPRLEKVKNRSLPADPDTARHEYDAAITRILKDAKVPASAYTVKPRAAEGKVTPELAPKKPAFSRVTLEITLTRVSYGTVLDVLSRYYRMNLLQQITKFTAKKTEELPQPPRGNPVSDRPDLTVTFVTEAIILDGAENRKSLFAIPWAMGAAGGGAGYATLYSSAPTTRGMTPIQWEPVLAVPSRDYATLLVKDIFHGNPPLPADKVVPVEVVKEDTSPFIRMTGFGGNEDGTGSAFIEDGASKHEYAITVTKVDGKLKAGVVKYYYTKGNRKAYGPPEPVLDISEASSRTARKFKVIGFDGDALVLAEIAANSSGKEGSVPIGVTGRRPSSTPMPRGTPPSAALVGGSATTVAPVAAAALANEKVFLWRPGESLNKVKEATKTETQKLLTLLAGSMVEENVLTAEDGKPQEITSSSDQER